MNTALPKIDFPPLSRGAASSDASVGAGSLNRPVPSRFAIDMSKISDHVRDYLLGELTSGRLKPGDRINEAELARRFGISRNPIREAISGLLQRGFLVSEPRRGAFMRGFTAKDVDDVFSFRICVETFAIRQAMPMMDHAARAEFGAIVDHMFEAAKVDDVGAFRHLDVLLHRRLCERSGNRQTLRAHEAIDTEMRMLMASVGLYTESLMEGAQTHVPIAEAIMGGDPEKVVEVLIPHIEQTWCHARAFYEDLEAANAAASKTRRGRSSGPAIHAVDPTDPSEEEVP